MRNKSFEVCVTDGGGEKEEEEGRRRRRRVGGGRKVTGTGTEEGIGRRT